MTSVPAGSDLLLVSKLGYLSQYHPVTPARDGPPLEVRLEPDSIVLKGLAVMTAQMETRTKRFPRSVREYAQERLIRSGASDIASFLELQSAIRVVPCPRLRVGATCVAGRGGRSVELTVHIDENEVPAGWEMLRTFPPREIYSIELFGVSRVYAYTVQYMEQIARRPRLLLDPCLPTCPP